jgi:putative transposase
VASGLSREAAAERYQVSYSSVIRWVGRAAATGSPAALPMGGTKPFRLAEQAEWIRARFVEKPDITGRELLAELHEGGIDVSYYGVWNFVDHLGLTFKKKRYTLASKTATMLPVAAHSGSGCKAK